MMTNFFVDVQMQQKLLLLLETALVEGKARDRGTSSLMSLGGVVSEIPTFDLPIRLDGDVHQGANWALEGKPYRSGGIHDDFQDLSLFTFM